jgi:hypothetical protein
MASREQIQKIRQQTTEAIKSFEDTFKTIDRLAEQNAPDEQINDVIRNSGIPDDAFVDAYQRYLDAGGIVDFGAGRSLLQGLTFGFADELEAILPSGVTAPGETYEQRLGQIRAGQTAFEGREPGTAMAMEALGALPTLALPVGIAARGLQAGAGMAGTMGRAALAGAGEGALGGFGRGEGATDRMQRAGIEGALGGALGSAAPLAAGGIARLFRGGRGAEQQTVERLTQAFPEAEMPRIRGEVEARIAAGETGEMMPETLTDIAGMAAQRQLRGVRGASPEVSAQTDPFLRGRTETQAQRLQQQLEQGAGINPEESDLLKALISRQERAAADAYEELRRKYPEIEISDMRTLFNSPAIRNNYQTVLNTMANRAAAGDVDPRVLETIPSYDEFIEAIRRGDSVSVPFDFLERMKRRISSEARQAKVRGDTETAGELGDLARALTQRIDERAPEYRQARELFAGPAEVQDALSEGEKFLQQTPASVESLLNELTGSEKRAYVTGAVSSLGRMIENTRDRADLVQKLFGTPANRRRLAVLMGGENSPQFRAFEESIKREARMVETRGIVSQGSQTAAFMRDIERQGMPIDTAVELLVNPTSIANPSMIGQMLAAVVNKIAGPSGDVAGRVGQRLLETDPRRQMQTLLDVENARRQAARSAQTIQRAGVLGGAAAGAVPSLLDVGE